MDIADIVSTEFEEFDVETPVSKVVAAFDETAAKVAVVTDEGEYAGVVTARQVVSGHTPPERRVGSLVWHVPRVERHENVREVARLLLGSGSMALPVLGTEGLFGVVTADDLLERVQPFLGVLDVGDVYTHELVTVGLESTFGQALHLLREHRITHLPVVDEGELVGVLSILDLLGVSTREIGRSQGGDPAFEQTGSSHGGFGAREGDVERMLDLPVRNVMTDSVETTTPEASLDDAVARMLDAGVSSLVVTGPDGSAVGIVTKRDALRALTVTDEQRLDVQVYGIDLLDDLTRNELRAMVESVTDKYGNLSVLDARVHLHEHDETLRGTPLLLARARVDTDRGYFIGRGEGYGARHAISLALNDVERQLLDGKTYGRSKKHPDEAYWEKLFGWWLSGPPG